MASQSTTGPELIHLGITNSDVRGASEGLGGGELAVVGTWVHTQGVAMVGVPSSGCYLRESLSPPWTSVFSLTQLGVGEWTHAPPRL